MADYDIDETIALDLGTSNSCCYFYKDGSLTLLQVEGKGTIPSVVRITEKATVVGEVAKKSLGKPDTLFELKRILARKYDDPVVTECVKNWPFNIEANEKGIPVAVIKLGEKESYVKPIDFYMYIIRYFIDEVKKQTGREVKNIVMTVPAYFGEHQRKATMFAAQTLNLRVLYLMNEPTAAAIAYACENDLRGKTILVYDLGGGTFDVSILEVKDKFEVLATSGDSHLGGIDFTNRLYEIIEKKVNDIFHTQVDLSLSQRNQLRAIAEELKISFSNETCDCMEVPLDDVIDSEDATVVITRDEFDAAICDLIERSMSVVMDCLAQANKLKNDIDDVILIGGSSQILAVRRSVQQFFGGKKPMANINPAEAVARGAMCFACEKKGINIVQTMIPLEETNAHHLEETESVVVPAGVEICEICPMRYVIEQPNDRIDIVVPKNARLPFMEKRYYRTYEDDQEYVRIHIAQGNSDVFSENTEYGVLEINGIPRKPKGEVRIELIAMVDAFCQVSFRAFCNGVPARLTVSSPLTLKRTDMTEAQQEMHRVELVQLRNQFMQKLEQFHSILETIEDDESRELTSDYYDEMYAWFENTPNPLPEDFRTAMEGIDATIRQYVSYPVCYDNLGVSAALTDSSVLQYG